MFMTYQWCPTNWEGDAAGYVVAYDPDQPTEIDQETTGAFPNECFWLVPRTLAEWYALG